MSRRRPCRACGATEDGSSLRHGILVRYLVVMIAFAFGLGLCIDLGSDYFGLGMACTLGLFFVFMVFVQELLVIRRNPSHTDPDHFDGCDE